MNKVNKILFLSSLFSFTSLSWAMDNYFICNTHMGVLSLNIDANHLNYEMKNSNGRGLSYSSPAPSYNGFLYNHYSRFQTDYLNISFNKNGFKYTIFSNYEDGNNTKGVIVINTKNQKEYTYNCNDDGVDKLSELATKLQCDREDSLGCQE